MIAVEAICLVAAVVVAWFVLSIDRAPTRTPPDEATAFSTFLTHVKGELPTLYSLTSAYATDAGQGSVAAFNDAAAVRAWAKGEAAWLDGAQTAACFAGAFTQWEEVRQYADLFAADALAGRYAQSTAEFDQMNNLATTAPTAFGAVSCP